MPAEDPLTKLLVDAAEEDRAQLAEALDGVLAVDGSSGALHLRPAFAELTAERKVVAVLLGQNAAHLLGRAKTADLAPKEVATLSGLAAGTVAPTLKKLLENHRLVSRGNDRRYSVPSARLRDAIAFLRGGRS